MVAFCRAMNDAAPARTEAPSPKRQAILAAAGALFVALGYGAVSMDAIARSANVSKATLYAHFSSKDLLFATIINDACRENIAAGDMFGESHVDLTDALRAIGTRLLRFLLSERALAIPRVVVAECGRFPELGRAFYENGPGVFRRMLAEWLDRRGTEGRLDLTDPTVAADHFIGMLRTGLYARATLGLAPAAGSPAVEAEIEATVVEAVGAFLRAYGPERSCMTPF